MGRVRAAGGLLAAAALVLGLVGCGSADDKGSDRGGSGGGFPVSVAGKFGTTTIEKRPQRVVALSWTDADFALALGVTPVGMSKDPFVPGGIQPWTKPKLKGATPTLFLNNAGDPVEKIAALHPDLILATKDYFLARSYQQLSKFAPVVTYTQAPNGDTWQQGLTRVATALGRPAEAKRVIRATEAKVVATGRAHPELHGARYATAVQPSASSVFTSNSRNDVAGRLLAKLGMRLSPALLRLKSAKTPGRAEISYEQADVLDADLLVLAADPAGAKQFFANPAIRRLSVVKRGAIVSLTYTTAQALAFPSPVSIAWGMDHVVPQYAAAVRKK